MTNNYLYEFKGQITGKRKDRVYNKRSEYYGNIFYRCQVELENKPELGEILVFPSSKVWKKVQDSEYTDKRLLFFCSPKVANYQIVSYQLIDWKKLGNSNQEYLENHGSNK